VAARNAMVARMTNNSVIVKAGLPWVGRAAGKEVFMELPEFFFISIKCFALRSLVR
jgi:hypothetical protein